MGERDNLSFVRWQNIRIEQFGFVNNLFIVLASGFLILEAQSVMNITKLLPSEACLIGISAILVFLSLSSGSFLAINRLLAFRKTAQIARKRETHDRNGLDYLRRQTSKIDERSWIFLWFQTGLFALGSILLVVVIIIRLLQFVL